MKKLPIFYCWLSLRENSFGVDSAGDQIISTFVQCVIKSFLHRLIQHLQKFSYLFKKRDYKESKFLKTNKEPNENLQKIVKISEQKMGLRILSERGNFRKSKHWQKSKEKNPK
jgi:hypothetical protein